MVRVQEAAPGINRVSVQFIGTSGLERNCCSAFALNVSLGSEKKDCPSNEGYLWNFLPIIGRKEVETVKTFERILIKIAVIQFVFLIVTQLFFHQLNVFPELKVITQYEGIVKEKNSDTVETIWSRTQAGK